MGCLGSGARQVLLDPSDHFWQVWGLILNMILSLLQACWGFSFALGYGVSFFGGIQHSPVDGCSATSCNFEFLQEKMSSCPSTLPSCRLFPLAKPKRTGEWDGWNEGYEEGVIIPQLRLQYPLPGGREAWAPFCHPHSDHKGSACNAEYQGSIPG